MLAEPIEANPANGIASIFTCAKYGVIGDNKILPMMDHAHPPPEPQSPYQQVQCQQILETVWPSRSVPTTPSSSSAASQVQGSLSLQQQRLQLRSTRFRASKLPSHTTNRKLSRWLPARLDDDQYSSPIRSEQENDPPITRRAHSGTEHHAEESPQALYEVANFEKNRSVRRRTVIPIFEEDEGIHPKTESPTSWYHDASSTQQSPVHMGIVVDSPAMMKLREISGNAQSPPSHISPLARQSKGRRKTKYSPRKSSFEASKYIDHLESQLQATQQSLISPNTGKPLEDKIRALQAENQDLRGQVQEWEERFEMRLKDAIEHKTLVELELTKRIKSLETQVSTKEATIQDLQRQTNERLRYDQGNVENLRLTNERISREKQCLEETNRGLERRNDILTELLAQTPTRAQQASEVTSPTREMFRRTPRPRSMLVKLPSPGDRIRPERPLSVQPSPSLGTSHDYFSPRTAFLQQGRHPANRDPTKPATDSHSLDSGLGESCSGKSPDGHNSKRSSMASSTPMSPSAWGFPLPASPTDDKSGKAARSRNLRRFASGSTSLKPLVLPALTGTGNPSSPSASSNHGIGSPVRAFSMESFDPTSAFISPEMFETPTQPRRRPSVHSNARSSAWLEEDALNALEGNSRQYSESFEEALARHAGRSERGIKSSILEDEYTPYLSRASEKAEFTPNTLDNLILEEETTDVLNDSLQSANGDPHSFTNLACELSDADIHGLPSLEDVDVGDFGDPLLNAIEVPSLDVFDPALNLDLSPLHLDPGRPPGFQLIVPPPAPTPPHQAGVPPAVLKFNSQAPLQKGQQALSNISSPSSRKRRRSEHKSSGTFDLLKDATAITPTPKIKLAVSAWPKSDVEPGSAVNRTAEPRSSRFTQSQTRRQKSRQFKSKPTLSPVTQSSKLGTFVQYTTCLARFRADPTAMARRVIANAWHRQWKRLGQFSWWVLGLFLGRKATEASVRGPGTCGLSESGRRKWELAFGGVEGLEGYEVLDQAEALALDKARATGSDQQTMGEVRRRGDQVSPQELSDESLNESEAKGHCEPQVGPDRDSPRRHVSGSWSRPLYLWGKFSFALILAIGGAVIEGPAAMLQDCDAELPRSSTTGSDITRSSTGVNRCISSPQSDSDLLKFFACEHALMDEQPAKRSRRKLDAQRNFMAADCSLQFGTSARSETVEAHSPGNRQGATRISNKDRSRQNWHPADGKENMQLGNDERDGAPGDDDDDDPIQRDLDQSGQTIRPGQMVSRQSIQDVSWFQNLGVQDFDRGRI